MKYVIMMGVIAISIVVISSCKKSDDKTITPGTTPSATIAINSPTAANIYKHGDTMYISAVITGDVKLHGYKVAVVDVVTGDTAFHADSHTHATMLNVEEEWVCTCTSETDLRLYISSAIDHDGLEVVKTMDLKAIP